MTSSGRAAAPTTIARPARSASNTASALAGRALTIRSSPFVPGHPKNLRTNRRPHVLFGPFVAGMLFHRPSTIRRDHRIDLLHQPVSFPESHDHSLVVQDVVARQCPALAVLEPLLRWLITADEELPGNL